ncbi:hypothetical protein SAMN05216436_10854 [bacterium A37T11]|nr:hypothetical protein SAMN05216436_10854 [bacterium A37T11]
MIRMLNCRRVVSGIFFLHLVTSSCQIHDNMQEKGAPYLQGVWKQAVIPYKDQLLSYTQYEFKFTCDSIYAIMQTHSMQKTITDSCYGSGNWTEYAKGIYVVRGDSLIVDGIFTKANGKQKISGCYRIGQFIPRFKIAGYTADSLFLENRFDQMPIPLAKTDTVICIPKPR